MPWWKPWGKSKPPQSAPEPAVGTVQNALTAAASAVKASRAGVLTQNERWQDDAWDFYDQLGEFRFAVDWKAEMISRVRLRAGRIVQGQDEPELIDEGPAADLVSELGGGIGGQSEMMSASATQLEVVGESWLVGEQANGLSTWTVRSNDEIRVQSGRYEVLDESSAMGRQVWRPLSSNSLVVRVWKPHKRFRHMADSPARSMRPTMRELELVNRKIQSRYLSRLASAGVFLIPDEVSFPVREEFQEAEDPFVEEWIETAREAIAQPGTASATVPIPMRVPSEYIEKFKFIDFTLSDADDDIAKRESAIRRLATQIDVPAEILLGLGDVNHWSAWQLEESAIKTHISSSVETIVNSLTIGYLHPRLKAMGENPEGLVVWYDTSELSIRPDRSENAFKSYDRLEINGEALRRETGFNETDAPNDAELQQMILRKLALNPQVGFIALGELTNDGSLPTGAPAPEEPEGDPETDPNEDDVENDRTEPDTRDEPPPTPGVDAVIQASSLHRLEVGMEQWTLHHPTYCQDATFTCPVAEASRYLAYHPGTIGNYECWLSPQGELIIGRRVFDGNAGFIPGHARNFKRKTLTNGAGTRSAS